MPLAAAAACRPAGVRRGGVRRGRCGACPAGLWAGVAGGAASPRCCFRPLQGRPRAVEREEAGTTLEGPREQCAAAKMRQRCWLQACVCACGLSFTRCRCLGAVWWPRRGSIAVPSSVPKPSLPTPHGRWQVHLFALDHRRVNVRHMQPTKTERPVAQRLDIRPTRWHTALTTHPRLARCGLAAYSMDDYGPACPAAAAAAVATVAARSCCQAPGLPLGLGEWCHRQAGRRMQQHDQAWARPPLSLSLMVHGDACFLPVRQHQLHTTQRAYMHEPPC